ncbi:MAG: hypothetical protein ABMB14_29670, partial [Myxococcota bacterium]
KVEAVAPKVEAVAPKVEAVVPKVEAVAPKVAAVAPIEVAPKVEAVAPIEAVAPTTVPTEKELPAAEVVVLDDRERPEAVDAVTERAQVVEEVDVEEDEEAEILAEPAELEQKKPAAAAASGEGGAAMTVDTPDRTAVVIPAAPDEEAALKVPEPEAVAPAADERSAGPDEEEQAQVEVAAELEVQEEPEVAVALGAAAGVDPLLLLDAKALGNSDQAKRKALGPDGAAAIAAAVAEAADGLGAAALDDSALAAVSDRVRASLDVAEILEARRDGRLDELVRGVLQTDALASRDEVVIALQQLVQDPSALAGLAVDADPATRAGTLAVRVIEHLAIALVDPADLFALAAYDHHDLLVNVVLTDRALNAGRSLSPMALRMGGFASVLFQLVVDGLGPADGLGAEAGGEAADPALAAESLRAGIVGIMKLLRTVAATSS